MKKLPYLAAGISLTLSLVIAFYTLNKGKSEVRSENLNPASEESKEYQLITQALNNPNSVIDVEEKDRVSSIPSDISVLAPIMLSPNDATRSQQAPELVAAALDSDVRYLYLSGASLRENEFVNTSSSKNLSIIRTLINKSDQPVGQL